MRSDYVMRRFELDDLEPRRLFSALPAISISDVSLLEGDAGTQNAMVVVSLNARSTKTVSVNYRSINGTATAGSDYNAVSGKLTFAPGEISKAILLPVKGDRIAEGNEHFLVNLSGVTSAKIADAQGIVTIVDDEPILGISDAGGCKGPDTTVFTFTVNLYGASDQAVTVNYATQDGTAIAGVDYSATFGTLIFSPGETSKTISVDVLGDPIEGPGSKAFYVALSGASSNAIVNPYYPTGTGTIIQSAQPPGCYWDSQSGRWAAYGFPDPGDGEYLPWG